MLSSPPKYITSYSGLTIMLSSPSRFDVKAHELLTATGGWYMKEVCLGTQGMNKVQCDIRLVEDERPLLNGTKCILALGEKSLRKLHGDVTSLGEQRGSPFIHNSIPVIASYTPQDTMDMQDYEGKYNPNAETFDDGEESEEDKEKSAKRHGKTSRKNWKFWLKRDTKRAIDLCTTHNGILPVAKATTYITYPSAEEVIKILTETKNETLYFDIETDANYHITVFSFCFNYNNVFIVPCISHDYHAAYGNLHSIFRALSISFRDNEVVAHNGVSFDFYIMASRYKISIGKRSYDTLIAHHRCWPEVEKSLGHCISHLTWEPYHKNEGNFSYGTREQASQLWSYCGKDVRTLALVREAIDAYAKTKVGLTESIRQANASIRPYLTVTLQGIRYEKTELDAIVTENDKYMMFFIRLVNYLVGPHNIKFIANKSKKSLLGSSSQCARYFHDLLGYPVIKTSPKTGKPTLDEKCMLKLKLKYSNPVIDLVLAYRKYQKESGSLGFTPWVEDKMPLTQTIEQGILI